MISSCITNESKKQATKPVALKNLKTPGQKFIEGFENSDTALLNKYF